jgi:alpha/beta superfamily hydrolase
MTEAEHQREVVRWFRERHPGLAKCIRLSMNGISFGSLASSQKGARMISVMKSQGMVKGESDLAFLVPRGEWHGLVIEMKQPGGPKPTEDQKDYIEDSLLRGYFTKVCYGSDEAIETISNYLKGEMT